MRVPRALLIACPLLLGACGMIAGLDGYQEGENLTADGGDGSENRTDGSSTNGAADAGSTVVVDGSVVVDDATVGVVAADATIPRDTGPASDAACTLTANSKSCNHDAASCCSSTCDETGQCTGLACAMDMMDCKNGLNLVVAFPSSYFRAEGNCCVNEFCTPNAGSNSDGKCGPCVKGGLTPPQRTQKFGNTDLKVYYDDACCSHQLDSNGNCK